MIETITSDYNAFVKFLYTSVAWLILSTLLVCADDPQLNEILSKHMEAMGGLTNWHQVESIRLAGTVEREGEVVDIVIIKKRPNQIRATVTVSIPGKEEQKLQLIRSHDGKTAWTATRLAGSPYIEKEELSEEAANELLADAGVLPRLIKLWREGAELELLPSKTIDGISCYVIEAKPEGVLNKYTFYISTDTYRVTQYTNEHPKKGSTVTHLSEYNSEHSILIPAINIIESEQMGKSVMRTESIQIGVGIYEEYFAARESPHTPVNYE